MENTQSRLLKLDAHVLAYLGGYTKHFLKATETLCKKECSVASNQAKVPPKPISK
jgi:hypothetical protein